MSRVSPRPSADRRRAARRTVAWGAAFVVGLHLALAAAMETARPAWRDPEYAHRLAQIRRLTAAAPDRPLVLALGTSRTQMGFSPAHMPTGADGPLVYAFGQGGAGPIPTLFTLDRLLRDGVRPAAVLLEYFPPTFAADGPLDHVLRDWLPKLAHDDLPVLRPLATDPDRLTAAWAATRGRSWSASRVLLQNRFRPDWLPWTERIDYLWKKPDAHGWLPFPLATIRPLDRANGLALMHRQYAGQLKEFKAAFAQDDAFCGLFDRCRREGIRAAVFVMPESPTFRGWYGPHFAARSRAHLDELLMDYGVPVFDGTAGFAEDDFADGHHLLRHGAAAFSRRLWDDHLRAWVAGDE